MEDQVVVVSGVNVLEEVVDGDRRLFGVEFENDLTGRGIQLDLRLLSGSLRRGV